MALCLRCSHFVASSRKLQRYMVHSGLAVFWSLPWSELLSTSSLFLYAAVVCISGGWSALAQVRHRVVTGVRGEGHIRLLLTSSVCRYGRVCRLRMCVPVYGPHRATEAVSHRMNEPKSCTSVVTALGWL
jgi:hypothetical protein